MSSISTIALQGIRRGFESAARHSEEIITSFSSGNDPAGAIIGLSQDQRAVEASAKVIKIDQEMDRAVLDILA